MMKCNHCNSEVADNARFCSQCGNLLSDESLALSIIDAAKIIGVTTQTVLNLIDKGCITQMGSGDHRRTYVSRASVMKFVDVFPDFKEKDAEIKRLKNELVALKKKNNAALAEHELNALFATSPARDSIIKYLCKLFLSSNEDEVVQYRYYRKLSIEQIAEKLGKTTEQVEVVLGQALRKLEYLSIEKHDSYELLKKRVHSHKETIEIDKRRIVFLEKLLAEHGITYDEENVPINILHLSSYQEGCLNRAGVYYLAQLLEMTMQDVRKIYGIGQTGLREINKSLDAIGFELEDEDDIYDEDDDDEDEEIIYDDDE